MVRQDFELGVEGQFDLIKGFVLGFLEGKGIRESAVFSRDHHGKGDSDLKHVLRALAGKEYQARCKASHRFLRQARTARSCDRL
jgi:hypothetical protein